MFDFRSWLRKKFTPILGATAVAAIMAGPASAGNIVLTGHDDDFHDRFDGFPGSDPAKQLSAMVAFARAGAPDSTLPVLVFDQGTEMTDSLKALGIAFTKIDPSAGPIAASNFDVTKYSAMVIASASSCGGCDNTVAGYTNINNAKAAIQAFINAGGGVAQTTGGTNASERNVAYAYLPKTAGVPAGSPPSFGYVQTADGAAVGIGAVNGDATHNFFEEPGTGSTSASYQVFERLGDPKTGTPETIGIGAARITGTTIIGGGVPEPASMTLAAMGLASLAGYRLRKRGKNNA